MFNSVKTLANSNENNSVRYSAYNSNFNDATIYMRKRKNYIKSEMTNMEFMHVQDNGQNEMIKPLCHIGL